MGKVIFSLCVSVHTSTGGRGVPDPAMDGGGPRFSGGAGGPQSQIFWGGGPRSQIFQGGSQVSDFPGGVPVSDFRGGGPWSQIFGGGSPVSIKGKNFDTRFGLIHVQTGENIFC